MANRTRNTDTQKNRSKQNTKKATAPVAKTDSVGTTKVLYQKMGDRWFAFSMIEEEVFVGSISQKEIDRLEAQKIDQRRLRRSSRTGNA